MTALIRTLASFALILILGRLRMPLAPAILCGAASAGLLFGLSPWELLLAAPSTALHPRSVGLMAITFLQLVLSGCMESGGQMRRIVESARAVFRRPALTMAALPALIGLLPMPGGALFSAPMVEAAAAGKPLSGERLSAINYWFRHIWEHWWPLYPGVLLAMTLTNRGFLEFARFQIPLGLMMALSGALLFRRLGADFHAASARPPRAAYARLAREVAPIAMIVVTWVPAALFFRSLSLAGWPAAVADTLRRFGPIAVGMAGGLVWTLFANRTPPADVWRVCRRRSVYEMLGLVVSVMVFQGILERVGAAPQIARELTALRVPPVIAVAGLPFVAGLVTGLAFGFVGASFPIVLGLVHSLDVPSAVPYIALAYAWGHLGQMVTPIHLCYVVSNRYFQTGFRSVYRHLLGPAAFTAAGSVVYFLLLRRFL